VGNRNGTTAGTVSVFVFFFRLVVFAIVSLVAGTTVIRRIADGFLRGELFALGAAGEEGDRIRLEDVQVVRDILRGDLEAVEKEAGTTRIEFRGGKGVEDLGKGDLDGAAVLQDRELEWLILAAALLSGKAVEAGVEVAIRRAAEGRRMTPDAVGHNMTTFLIHLDPPPQGYSAWKFLIFNEMTGAWRGKFLILIEFAAES
jgi:hypothetical protein